MKAVCSLSQLYGTGVWRQVLRYSITKSTFPFFCPSSMHAKEPQNIHLFVRHPSSPFLPGKRKMRYRDTKNIESKSHTQLGIKFTEKPCFFVSYFNFPQFKFLKLKSLEAVKTAGVYFLDQPNSRADYFKPDSLVQYLVNSRTIGFTLLLLFYFVIKWHVFKVST